MLGSCRRILELCFIRKSIMSVIMTLKMSVKYESVSKIFVFLLYFNINDLDNFET